jgi:hypothetical protein
LHQDDGLPRAQILNPLWDAEDASAKSLHLRRPKALDLIGFNKLAA